MIELFAALTRYPPCANIFVTILFIGTTMSTIRKQKRRESLLGRNDSETVQSTVSTAINYDDNQSIVGLAFIK